MSRLSNKSRQFESKKLRKRCLNRLIPSINVIVTLNTSGKRVGVFYNNYLGTINR